MAGSPATGSILPPADNGGNALLDNPNTSVFYGSQQQNVGNGANAQTSAGNQLNQYTAGQQQLQQQLPQTLSGIISGQAQIPPYWTAPPQVFQAYNDAFNAWTAPQIAAKFGAGSPQIASQQSMGNEQLAAQLYQGGQANFLNYLNSAANVGFNPVGQQTANTQGQNWQQNQNQNTIGYQTNSPLGALGLGGAAAGSVLSQLINLIGG